PEQALDSHGADGRSDVYSLGCTLYFLLTGKLPYPGKSAMEKFRGHRNSPIPSILEKRPDAPGHIDAVFREMVAKDPADRYQSMEEMVAALNCQPQAAAVPEAWEDDDETADYESVSVNAALPQRAAPAPPRPSASASSISAMSSAPPVSSPHGSSISRRPPRKPKAKADALTALIISIAVAAVLMLLTIVALFYM
ncbi:MAG: hypothetical protein N2C14_13535, partial [Planctomycetales bacterium]